MNAWVEADMDALSSTNTGVFANTAERQCRPHNQCEGSQLAFLVLSRATASGKIWGPCTMRAVTTD